MRVLRFCTRGALALAVVAALALAGCGDDPAPAPGSEANPLTARTPEPDSQTPGASAGRTNEAAAPAGSEAGGKPSFEALVDNQSANPRTRFTPCNLVTKAQARRYMGAALLEPVEAPQGPTCVYQAARGDDLVTVAIQAVDFTTIKPNLQQPREVTASGKTAYCGHYGRDVLYVPLAAERVLAVSGPCSVARRFAAAAVRELA